MLNKIHISPKAAKSIYAVYKTIVSEFGTIYAMRFYAELKRKQQQLLLFPESGHIERVTPAGRRTYRSRIVGKHNKLVYYATRDTLYITALWDMRMEKPE